jgi:hypothetical protein
MQVIHVDLRQPCEDTSIDLFTLFYRQVFSYMIEVIKYITFGNNVVTMTNAVLCNLSECVA